jgi:DNA-directed RNA polymerase subunit L
MATAKKLDVHSATSDYSKTYVFHDEDHTLGNSLRYVLMRKYVSLSLSSSLHMRSALVKAFVPRRVTYV